MIRKLLRGAGRGDGAAVPCSNSDTEEQEVTSSTVPCCSAVQGEGEDCSESSTIEISISVPNLSEMPVAPSRPPVLRSISDSQAGTHLVYPPRPHMRLRQTAAGGGEETEVPGEH